MLATALHACGATLNAASAGGSSGGFGLPTIALGAVATFAVAATILAAGFLGLALTVILSRRGDPATAAVPAGATISPDGLYWWDGATWRPVR